MTRCAARYRTTHGWRCSWVAYSELWRLRKAATLASVKVWELLVITGLIVRFCPRWLSGLAVFLIVFCAGGRP